ncbi:MAG: hypothetical protein FJ279_05365 [Planctomycetes bacterium]|nr:hypothetical protein [Planctomycetota bacterium]
MRDLAGMTFEQLRNWLRDRMLLRGLAAADIDRRRDETPYDAPLAHWRKADDAFRQNLARAAISLLEEIPAEGWPPEHCHNLVTLIEEAGMSGAIERLKDIVFSQAWLRGASGPQLHMLALRTLLGLGWKGDPNFWIRQPEQLASEYPELVFRGLLEHGLDIAFSRLNDVVRDPEAMRRVLWLFPRLVEIHGLGKLRAAAASAARRASEDVAEEIERWFRVSDYIPAGMPGYEPSEAHLVAAGLSNWQQAEDQGGWQAESQDPQRALAGCLFGCEGPRE